MRASVMEFGRFTEKTRWRTHRQPPGFTRLRVYALSYALGYAASSPTGSQARRPLPRKPIPRCRSSSPAYRRRVGQRRFGSHLGGHALPVHHVLQLFARLKERNFLGRNLDTVAGLRVAANPWFALPRAEAAKATNLDLVSRAQRAHHTVEDRLHNDFAVLAGQLGQSRNFFDKIGFRHLFCFSVFSGFSIPSPARAAGA